MMAFKNNKPQIQSFTDSYQAFGEPPSNSIQWLLLAQKENKLRMHLLDMCIYNLSCIRLQSVPSFKSGITR
jgi:hypothetical protein